MLFTFRTGFDDFKKWPMMTVHYWGEQVSPGNATWKVLISNAGDKDANFITWSITFFGTKDDPQPGKLGPS